MTDPFAAALVVLFVGPGSIEATYTPEGGRPLAPIRVVRVQGSEEIPLGDGQIRLDVNLVHIRRIDVDEPCSGDRLTIGDREFTLQGDPKLDVEGLTWSCDLEPE